MKFNPLNRVIARLEERLARPSPAIRIPGLWIDPTGPVAAQSVVPEQFFLDSLRGILASPRRKRVTDEYMAGWFSYEPVSKPAPKTPVRTVARQKAVRGR